MKFAQVVGVFPGPRFDDAEGEAGEAEVELLGWEEPMDGDGMPVKHGEMAINGWHYGWHLWMVNDDNDMVCMLIWYDFFPELGVMGGFADGL